MPSQIALQHCRNPVYCVTKFHIGHSGDFARSYMPVATRRDGRRRPQPSNVVGAGLGVAMVALAILYAPGTARAAAASPYTISLDPYYFNGNYGGPNNTSIYEVPVTLEYHGPQLRLKIEIPYVAISGAGVLSGNNVVQAGQQQTWRTGLGIFGRRRNTESYRPPTGSQNLHHR